LLFLNQKCYLGEHKGLLTKTLTIQLFKWNYNPNPQPFLHLIIKYRQTTGTIV